MLRKASVIMRNSTFRKLKRKYLCISAILEKFDFSDNITAKELESKHLRKEKMLKIFLVYNYLLNTD